MKEDHLCHVPAVRRHFALAALLGLATATAYAGDTLSPLIPIPSCPDLLDAGQVSTSQDGYQLLISRPTSLDYFGNSGRRRLTFATGSKAVGVLSPDGQAIYYSLAQMQKIARYDTATGTLRKFPVSVKLCTALAISPDGTKLAYVDEVGGNPFKVRVRLFNLKTETSVTSFDVGAASARIAFAGNSKLVIDDGTSLVVYDAKGALLNRMGSLPGNLTEAPDGSRLFNASLEDGKLVVTSYALPSLAKQWTTTQAYSAAAGSATTPWIMVDKQAGFKKVCAGVMGSTNLISSLSVNTGQVMISMLQPSPDSTSIARAVPFDCHWGPRFMVALDFNTPAASAAPRWEIWTYDEWIAPYDFSRRQLMAGYRPANLSSFQKPDGDSNPSVGLAWQGDQQAAYLGWNYGNEPVKIPTWDKGKYAVSPDGAYYAGRSNGKLRIYLAKSGAQVAAYPVGSGVSVSSWISTGRLALTFSGQVDIVDFDGTSLKYVRSFDRPEGSKPAVLSTDGQLMGLATPTSSKLYRVEDGSLAANIAPVTGAPLSISFADNGSFGIHEFASTNNEATVRFRVFKTKGFKEIRTIQFDETGDGRGWGRLSPNGLFVALSFFDNRPARGDVAHGTVRMYRVSDGSLVRQWDDQYVPQGDSSVAFMGSGTSLVWDMGDAGGLVEAMSPAFIRPPAEPLQVTGGKLFPLHIQWSGPRPEDENTVTWSTKSKYIELSPGYNYPVFWFKAIPAVDQPIGATIVATYHGVQSSYPIQIMPVSSMDITMDPPLVDVGKTTAGTLKLHGPAGPAGVTVKLWSTNPAAADVSVSSIFIPAGQWEAKFTVNTVPTSKVESLRICALVDRVGKAPAYSTFKDLWINHPR